MKRRHLLGGCAILCLLLLGSASGALPQTWYVLNSPTNTSLTAVVNGAGPWLAVGSNSTILLCQDGFRWKQVADTFSSGGDFLSLAYGNGLYVAGGTLGNLLCI